VGPKRPARSAAHATATDTGRKLDVVRAAAGHSFPAPDVAQMLAEIERGYTHDAGR
jgi:hypothetical protein